MEIRTLRADEIECRVQQIKTNGCALLLYNIVLDYYTSILCPYTYHGEKVLTQSLPQIYLVYGFVSSSLLCL